jgi:hypothetical protein
MVVLLVINNILVDETGHRPEGVGVSRDVGRTKTQIRPTSSYASFLRISGALHLNVFDQPVE